MANAKKIWVLISYRAGMNSQIRGLAEALDLPYEEKRLCYRRGWAGWWPAYLCRSSLRGIVREGSSPLDPPWPDLIVTAGRRHEPVCRWIRERSGGRTRLVFLGRTWAPLRHFDLVVTTPQYRLPPRSNVLENGTTLHRITRERLHGAAERVSPWLGKRARPRIAVLVGGSSGPFAFGPRAARRLVRQSSGLAERCGGSLMVTTSARTPPEVTEILRRELPADAHFYPYAPDDEANPYFGFLALADAIVVSGDSIAMISEALATGAPLLLFDLGAGDGSMRATDTKALRIFGDDASDRDRSSRLYRLLLRFGPPWLGRDITLVHRRLVANDLARWLDDRAAPAWIAAAEDRVSSGGAAISARTSRRTVERVLELIGLRAAASEGRG